jgi:peptide/nickel transport system substrate-binding protein
MVRTALLLCLLVTGCRDPLRSELVVAYPLGPTSLVPNAANEELTDSIVRNVCESLVEIDAELVLRPGLAESWTTPNERTWEFRLREGVRLHDGRALDAQDVVRSVEHARSDPASPRRGQLAAIEAIEATGPQTIVVHTRTPFEPVPTRLSNIFIWAAPARAGDPPLGTGPYRIRSWSLAGDTVLQSSGTYRRGKPQIEVVEFRVVPDIEDRMRRLREGSVDLILDVPAERMGELKREPRLTALSRDGLRVVFLGMDCAHTRAEGAANPFRDVRVRRAVALAIDRRGLVDGPLGGLAEIVDQIADPHELGYASTLASRPHDAAESRRLLVLAGHPKGFTVALDYVPHKYRAVEAVVASLASDLGKVGIRVVPRPGSFEEVVGRIERRETSFYLLGWLSEIGDVRLSYEYLLHSPGEGFGLDNGGGYSDPEMDRLIEEVSERLAPEERKTLLRRIAKKVYDEVPIIPLYRQADLYALKSDLVFAPRLDRGIQAFDIRWASRR